MVSPVVLAHISPLYDWAWKSRGVGGGQGRTPGAESGQYFSKCPCENGRLDSPRPRRSLGASDSSM